MMKYIYKRRRRQQHCIGHTYSYVHLFSIFQYGFIPFHSSYILLPFYHSSYILTSQYYHCNLHISPTVPNHVKCFKDKFTIYTINTINNIYKIKKQSVHNTMLSKKGTTAVCSPSKWIDPEGAVASRNP